MALKDRFVVSERTSVNHARRQIVANPESVAIWLWFLFKNHTEFLKMEKDGELRLSEEALRVLQSQSELGEVLEDVEYVNDSDEENDTEKSPKSRDVASVSGLSSRVHQPELESGFSRTDDFTFDK